MSDVVLAALIAPAALILQGLLQSWMQGRRDREKEERDDARAVAEHRRADEVAESERRATLAILPAAVPGRHGLDLNRVQPQWRL